MGTWSAPDNPNKKKKLNGFIKKLDKIKQDIQEVFEDDELLDLLEFTQDRIRWALNQEWHESPKT